jgi:hypothetical protein
MKAAAGGETGALVKDDDAVKLFVGQVPKDMGDEDLRGYFAPFGEIFDISIIRDKITGAHRGCAFLTFTTKSAADAAIEALHNKCKLPNAQNPLQVRLRFMPTRGGLNVARASRLLSPRALSLLCPEAVPPPADRRSGQQMYIVTARASCSWGCCPRRWTTCCSSPSSRPSARSRKYTSSARRRSVSQSVRSATDGWRLGACWGGGATAPFCPFLLP